MYTTQLDNGTLNNYAVEPKMTGFTSQGAIAAFFVTALVLISFAIS
jgi:hypothetical protein